MKPTLTYAGAHFRNCPVELRELWTEAFDSQEGRKEIFAIAKEILGHERVAMVPVFTCNRFDLYLSGDTEEQLLIDLFSRLAQIALERNQRPLTPGVAEVLQSRKRLQSTLRLSRGEDALLQLFRVAASLDSLVVGEPHILGQLKEQFFMAQDLKLTQSSLETAFRHSFHVAKRVRSETGLGRNGVSIGHAAVSVVSRVFDDLSRHSALVIGAGEMGRITAQHLHAQGAREIAVANRDLRKAEELIQELGSGQALGLEHALALLYTFDVVVVATAARSYLVNPSHIKPLERRRKGRPMVLVDISVPRNVDPACADLLESLFLFDVDDLDQVMEANRELRREAAQLAERVIKEGLEKYFDTLQAQGDLAEVAHFHQHVYAIVYQQLNKETGISEERAKVISRSIAKRLVSAPAQLTKSGYVLESSRVGPALEDLFQLHKHLRQEKHT